jgi:uncharacterized membrane protein
MEWVFTQCQYSYSILAASVGLLMAYCLKCKFGYTHTIMYVKLTTCLMPKTSDISVIFGDLMNTTTILLARRQRATKDRTGESTKGI